ncbi:MAG: glycoside hydrolase family protein [Helicobacteraceae bacterium]|jgi:lysozyme|nr:glycoside hydrolase family protein [Helicobacteraceae bacterium]
MSYLEKAKEQIKKHEGLRLKAYKDSLGFWTIGYGHLCDGGKVMPVKAVIDKTEANELFETDFAVAFSDVSALFASVWQGLSDNRKIALIDMSFNLGIGKLAEFKQTLAAIKRGDFEAAANAALASKWAKQVGKRAITITEQIRKG